MELTERNVLHGILTLLWTKCLWETYLSIRQFRKCKETIEMPDDITLIMSEDSFYKERLISLAKHLLEIIENLVEVFISSLIVYFRMFATTWEYAEKISISQEEEFVSCMWTFVFSTLSTILNVPLVLYYTYFLKEKRCFTDQLKNFLLIQIVILPISVLTVWIVKHGGEWFFVWSWLMSGLLLLFLVLTFPPVIASMLNKFRPLPDGELRTKIENLADQVQFPLTQLLVVEGCKRSVHSSAYITSFFKSKRIILYDNLLKNPQNEGCTNDEVEAIVAHELGHWQHNHTLKRIILLQLNLLLWFFVFAKMFHWPLLYRAIGFEDLQPILVGLIVVRMYIMIPYNTISFFAMSCFSRYCEYQADEFAIKLGYASPLKSSIIKLYKDNLTFPICDHFYSFWYYSHPPLLERLAAIDAKTK